MKHVTNMRMIGQLLGLKASGRGGGNRGCHEDPYGIQLPRQQELVAIVPRHRPTLRKYARLLGTSHSRGIQKGRGGVERKLEKPPLLIRLFMWSIDSKQGSTRICCNSRGEQCTPLDSRIVSSSKGPSRSRQMKQWTRQLRVPTATSVFVAGADTPFSIAWPPPVSWYHT